MKVKDFSEYLEKINSTTKRLEKTSILAELFTQLKPPEVKQGVYLSLGYILPSFLAENKINIADKMMIRVLEKLFPTAEDILTAYKTSGDLGDTAYNLFNSKKDLTGGKMELVDVYNGLEKILETSGEGSQEAKVDGLASLMESCDALSAKYLTRIVLGNTRLGFTELTWMDAFAQSLGLKKQDDIESVYNTHPDIGLIALKLKVSGFEGLKDIHIEPGVPVLSQRAQRAGDATEIIQRVGTGWAEFKLDGTRVQLHFQKTKTAKIIKTFTRNLEETTHQFPEIIEDFQKNCTAESIILDGEAIGFNRESGEFLDFQQTIKRKRKHGVEELSKSIPVKYVIFDILYLNGKETTSLSLKDRHELIRKAITPSEHVVIVEHVETNTVEELEDYFSVSRAKNLEGLIIKKPEDAYQAGARSYSWIKLKNADTKLLEDSIDCVVLGYYFGKGERTKFGLGGFLMGVYDEKEKVFKTLTKLGTGLKDEDLIELKILCDKYKTQVQPHHILSHKTYTPDTWLIPGLVLEISGDEISKSPTHSCGYAMRFPRLIKIRKDKNEKDCTTTTEIEDLYSRQKTHS